MTLQSAGRRARRCPVIPSARIWNTIQAPSGDQSGWATSRSAVRCWGLRSQVIQS